MTKKEDESLRQMAVAMLSAILEIEIGLLKLDTASLDSTREFTENVRIKLDAMKNECKTMKR